MQPGDRLIVAFTQIRPIGERFSRWYPHITIVPWFRAGISDEDLAGELQLKLAELKPFIVEIGPEERFGARGRKLVNLVRTPSPLEKIEKITRQLLQSQNAWLVDESTKAPRHFRPHVTVQESGRVHEGDKLECDRLYLVTQEGSSKLITKEVSLNE